MQVKNITWVSFSSWWTAQFRELASFSQFSTDLDQDTRNRIERGQRLTELLKQAQYSPYALWEMYAAILVTTTGLLDKVPLEKIKPAEAELLRELRAKHSKMIEQINSGALPEERQKEAILSVGKAIAASYEPVAETKKKKQESV